MKKRKTIKIASIATGAVIAVVCMFIFLMPVFGNTEPPENTIKAEGTTVNNNTDNEQEALTEKNKAEDIDDVQDEVADINEANDVEEANKSGDLNEANDIEEANEIEEDKNGDLEEAGENLPGGGHEDANGVEIDHQFEGVE